MKNTRTYPFERNRYFYGKLLTVRDFESEQKYFNDKRRLMNRLMYGSGVIAGMQVVAVDDKSVTVEMGVGMDTLGREIVVPSPATHKLSAIEGFSNNEYAKNVYLCIAYDERGKEPVHSVANSSVRAEEVSEYNRWLESYRLFVREEAPDLSLFEEHNSLANHALLYQEGHLRLWQKTPKYVNPGEVFEVELHVEKTLQTPRLALEFEVESDLFEVIDQQKAKVEYQEPKDSQSTEHVIRYLMKAGPQANHKGEIALKAGTAKLTVGDKQVEVYGEAVNHTEIVDQSKREQVIGQHYNRTLDQSMQFTSEPCIYLAKISLLQIESTYMIEQVEQMPFQELVYNNSVLGVLQSLRAGDDESAPSFSAISQTQVLDHDAEPKASVSYDQSRQQFYFQLGLPAPKRFSDDLSAGVVEIKLDKGEKSGRFLKSQMSYFSGEIEHGLGVGNIYINVGLEDEDRYQNEQASVYFGDADVFSNSEYETSLSKMSVGTVLYPNKGTFRVGVKTQQNVEVPSIRLKWWAFKSDPALFHDKSYLEAAAANEDNVDESIKDSNGDKEETK